MKAGEALNAASARLASVSVTPRLDAELLMAHALGVTREAMLLGDHAAPPSFDALTERRLRHEPVAYITGQRDFWSVSLHVGPGVLIPRPDSETLIEAAAAYFANRSPKRILDLGTGSGALLLAALDQWQEATGLGIDASASAVAIASANGDRIAPGRAAFGVGNWADGIAEQFDLILCNPPYVAAAVTLPPDVVDYEPASALFAGEDGLDCYREIVPVLPRLLAPDGMIAVEIGHCQAEQVSALFRNAGLHPEIRHDLAGRARAIVHFALGDRRTAV